MIHLRRPSPASIAAFADRAAALEPSYPAPGDFSSMRETAIVGPGAALDTAAEALFDWRMQHGAGVFTDRPAMAPGATVVLWTRMFGLWLRFACRVTDVVRTEDEAGFTYVTLPGHPEQGEETFTLRRTDDDELELEISATWRPGRLETKLAGPIAGLLQKRATQRYVDAMRTLLPT